MGYQKFTRPYCNIRYLCIILPRAKPPTFQLDRLVKNSDKRRGEAAEIEKFLAGDVNWLDELRRLVPTNDTRASRRDALIWVALGPSS